MAMFCNGFMLGPGLKPNFLHSAFTYNHYIRTYLDYTVLLASEATDEAEDTANIFFSLGEHHNDINTINYIKSDRM